MPAPLTEPTALALPAPALPKATCENCGTPLDGEYCSACGQRHEPHVHSIRHFAAEAVESISHADSRLWRTIGYLLTRPGYLTREFFAGRRARYLPPFRLYLVISVLFFLIVGIPEDLAQIGTSKPTADDAAELKRIADELEKRSSNSLADDIRKQVAGELRKKAAATADASKEAAPSGEAAIPTDHAITGGIVDFCRKFDATNAAGHADRQKIFEWCNRFTAGGARTFAHSLARNLPHAMFVFLPLLALFMKALYWRPKRYYVEHLLFLVHNHAFVFLAIILMSLVLRIPFLDPLAGWLGWGLFFYIAWYIFRAMRNVYGQGRGLTFAKYMAIGCSYWIAALITFSLTAAYSLMMI